MNIKIKNLTRRNRSFVIIFCFILFQNLILINGVLAAQQSSAKKSQQVNGNKVNSRIKPLESISYQFSGNKLFGISTDVEVDLNVEYQKEITNREVFLVVNNSNPILFEVKAKIEMKNFGFLEPPEEPDNINSEWEYNCIYQLRLNSTISNEKIEKLTFQFNKNSLYGLDPDKSYSLAIYESGQDRWETIYTTESNLVSLQISPDISVSSDTTSSAYLEGSLTNLESNKEYYVTIYELKESNNIWIFWIIIIVIGFISLIVVLSKSEYVHYLKTRTTPIEKGAHRLSLDDVLENENRNKIIDLILKEPGVHFNELLRKTSLAAGNLVWHLDILETYKIIGKKRIGNFIAYFPYYNKNPVSNIDLKLRKSKLTLEILEMIEKEPGTWNSMISKKFKVDHKTTHYHVNKLMDLDLINVKKDGRKSKLFPNFNSEYYSQNK